ncbi:MAG: PepSY domain-containing protein [Flavobacterium sp.]
MNESNKRKSQAKTLRIFRKVHRFTGAFLFVFFFVISITGLFLGWKKNSNGLLLADSRKGTTTDLRLWLPIDSLKQKACNYLQKEVGQEVSLVLNRIDIRPEKGMVKFVFEADYWAVQLDGATGQLLHLERRNADFVENIHDGSYLDACFETGNGIFKLVYTTIMGLALLVFTITGFWLWYGPKRMRA